MPRKDKVHDIVRLCLEADCWTISHDPYYVKALGADYDVDLGAEKLVAAEKGLSKIAVEVKSFSKPSFSNEFHSVLGQYLNYAILMSVQEPDRKLYLAVSKSVYRYYFRQPSVEFVVHAYNVNILVFNPLTNQIDQWSEK